MMTSNMNNTSFLPEDKNLIKLMHISQLLILVTGIGSLIVPLIIWLVNKDKVADVDAHGKQIINFQISMFILCLICVPLILALGAGILGMIAIGVFIIIYPIINTFKLVNNEPTYYPFTWTILK